MPGHAVPDPVRIGVAGTGAMGHHHVRLLAANPRVNLIGIYDNDLERAEGVADEFGCRQFADLAALADECEALVVAVPTDAHLGVAETALGYGCHLLIEKPLAKTVEEGKAIQSAGKDRIVAVGHIEFYNPATQALLSLGRTPRYVEVQRRSGFTQRSLDIDVIADLMIHDLQILGELNAGQVTEVRALGTAAFSPNVDIANARLEFASGMVANLTASRMSVQRERQLRAFFPDTYCSLDFEAKSMTRYHLEPGEGALPQIARQEVGDPDANPLALELDAFVDACQGDAGGVVGVEQGLLALQTAAAISDAIEENRRTDHPSLNH